MPAKAPQYQSFPGTPGDSESLAKLKALRLPLLVGQRFLDIGCNEGFFCGYAKFAGATRVVGLDASHLYIERACQRFPGVEFLNRSWDELPAGPFDVILLASSLHYARDQSELINRAVKLLANRGTLVLELGVVAGKQCEWVEVDRGADKRLYPTWSKLTEILKPHAWKLIKESVGQKGDPVSRYVLHINARRPVAYLVMQPPGFGKTTVCQTLFKPAGVPVVSGDQCLVDISKGLCEADEELRALVVAKCTPDSIDKTTLAILSAGLLPALVQAWLAKAGGQTFALDSSLPASHHAEVMRIVEANGYLAIKLDWERPGHELQASGKVLDMADAYFTELATPLAPERAPQPLPFKGTLGALTLLGVNTEILEVTGWAVHEDGRMPRFISIRLGPHVHTVSVFDRVAQPWLQKRMNLPHPMYGFRIKLPIPQGLKPTEVRSLLQVFGGNDESQLQGPFLSGGVTRDAVQAPAAPGIQATMAAPAIDDINTISFVSR